MSCNEVVDLLGKPSGTNPGAEMLETGPNGRVIVSAAKRSELEQTTYCMWKRPEGICLLVIVSGKLERIYQKP
jgi:hypothetical protein